VSRRQCAADSERRALMRRGGAGARAQPARRIHHWAARNERTYLHWRLLRAGELRAARTHARSVNERPPTRCCRQTDAQC